MSTLIFSSIPWIDQSSPILPSFKTLDPQYKPLFDDDYDITNLFSLKYRGTTQNFLLNAQGNIQLKRLQRLKSSGQLKILTKLTNQIIIETKFTHKGIIRLWTSLGFYHIGLMKRPIGLYGKIKFSTDFDYFGMHIQGLFNPTEKYEIYGKISISSNNDLALNARLNMMMIRNKMYLSCIGKYSLGDHPFKAYNVYIAYRNKNYDVIFGHVARKNDAIEIGDVSVTGYWKYGQCVGGGLKLIYRPDKNKLYKKFNAILGMIFKLNQNTVLKAKIDHRCDFSTALKHKFNNNLGIAATTTISLTFSSLLSSQYSISSSHI